jgi:hydrogenase expression/formation protein HypC
LYIAVTVIRCIMCLAVPARVKSIQGPLAVVAVEEVEYKASLALLEEVAVGDWVMVHAGFAISKLDEAEARETLRLIREIESSSAPCR